MSIKRGCGTRGPGGIYFEFNTGPGGRPLEDFLLCPPQPIDPAWGLTPVSTRVIENCILDWIGEGYWPNVADYLEEVRNFGVSARLPKNLDFSKLTRNSLFCPVHSRGLNHSWNVYPERQYACPSGLHEANEGPCAGYHWEDITEGMPRDSHFYLKRPTQRQMPSFMYTANARPDAVIPEFEPAVIACFPCTRIVVVRGDGFDESYEKASAASGEIPVVPVDE